MTSVAAGQGRIMRASDENNSSFISNKTGETKAHSIRSDPNSRDKNDKINCHAFPPTPHTRDSWSECAGRLHAGAGNPTGARTAGTVPGRVVVGFGSAQFRVDVG